MVRPDGLVGIQSVRLSGLENAVAAAATHLGIDWKPTHYSKYEAAMILHEHHGLPDVAAFLRELNELRKSESYGDVEFSDDLDAEEIGMAIEDYIDRVQRLMEEGEE